jgi:hypothetical protein
MAETPEDMEDWNAYPTYDVYVSMMQNYANNYPDICELIDAGETIEGRNILFLKISDNVSSREAEPQFMYSSTMHGDETTGYVLMLRLIDSLLTTYGTDTRITNIVDSIEIWINPNANPDGTYRSGNDTVSGAIRYNANYVDLNRNFPDPWIGDHPDGNPWQPETIIMMDIASANQFVMSANFHGGTEVVNYPWDGFTSSVNTHADDAWFQFISHEYADNCQANSPPGYMDGFNDGITNGGDWYVIHGGRQDYFTYFHYGRETTIEISDIKLLPASQLPDHWNYNKESFLLYLEQTFYGIRGNITFDPGVSDPIAKIEIIGHDKDNSEVYSDPVTNSYWRLIKAGTYSITFSSPGYATQTLDNILVNDYETTILDVHMTSAVPVELVTFTARVKDDGVLLNWSTETETNNKGFEIERLFISKSDFGTEENRWLNIGFVPGYGTISVPQIYHYYDEKLETGQYKYRLKQIDFDGSIEYSHEVEILLSNNSPKFYQLFQNYPNPFNPGTTIKYQIPFDGFVSLKIYNLLGENVVTLVYEQQSIGEYSVYFDGSNLSAGIYVYKFESGGFKAEKKLLLLK